VITRQQPGIKFGYSAKKIVLKNYYKTNSITSVDKEPPYVSDRREKGRRPQDEATFAFSLLNNKLLCRWRAEENQLVAYIYCHELKTCCKKRENQPVD